MTVTNQTLLSALESHVKTKGDEILYYFISDDEGQPDTLTYRQLYDQAQSVAKRIAVSADKGARALMLFDNDAQFVIAFFACLMAGVVAVPVYPPRKRDDGGRLTRIVGDAQPSLIVSCEKIAALCAPVLSALPAFAGLGLVKVDGEQALPGQVDLPEIRPDDIAFLQYSSGSTGTPKGVIVSHRNIVHNQSCFGQASGHDQSSSIASWLPYFHDMGLSGGILQPAFTGFSCYLMSPNFFLQKPVRWLKAMSDYRIRSSGAPNFAWDLCTDKITDEQLEGLDLSHWKIAYHGAEPIKADTLRRFAERFGRCGFRFEYHFPCYGMAETTLFVSGRGHQRHMDVLTLDGDEFAKNKVVELQADAKKPGVDIVSCGVGWCGSKLNVVDPETRQVLPDGQVGEIWFASESVAKGYWNKPEINREVFEQALAEDDGYRYLRTGDLGFMHKGEVFVTGRLKDLIIIRGRNYYPQDIEHAAFSGDDQLKDNLSAAFSVEGERGESLVVIQEVERSALRNIDAKAAIRALRDRVAERVGLAPDDVVLIRSGSIAKTSSGKVQRSRNKSLYLKGELQVIGSFKQAAKASEPSAAADSAQQGDALVSWLRQAIAVMTDTQVSLVGIDDNFLSLGLNSLKAVELIDGLGKFIGQNLSPTLVYDYPTIGLLSAHLSGDTSLQRKGHRQQQERDIAVIGMACRFPGAADIETFWHNLEHGRSAIRPFPKERYYGFEPDSAHYNGGYLDDVAGFDDKFFSLTAKEAKLVDPQHRVLLELAENTLRHAGYHPSELQGSYTGVFIGISQSDYQLLCANSEEFLSPYVGTGTSTSIAANRISYFYDFRGPSMAIDTACSSSMVALRDAVESLRKGESPQALVAGVKMVLFSDGITVLKNAQMLSATGACQAFDANADGYVRSEGAAMVLLKPYSQAQAAGDNILAIVKGCAVNQDGRSNGITAPNGVAQQEVIEAALADAGLQAGQVSYVEAHGTGTPLGDPIEVGALARVYGSAQSKEAPLLIGSVKANIGHLEPAAGIAGFIKAILCLQHRRLVPQIHFNEPNPHIDWENIAVRVNRQAQSWPQTDGEPLIAGVNSFGFGGTNAHAILQQAPVEQERTFECGNPSMPAILALRARDEKAMSALKQSFAAHLSRFKSIPLSVLCAQYNRQLDEGSVRTAFVAQSHRDMIAKLGQAQAARQAGARSAAFMFTGQGSQYHGMAADLYQAQPLFRAAVDSCEQVYAQLTGESLLGIINPPKSDCDKLNQTQYTQPAIFAIEYALSQLWLAYGIEPQAVLGHSIGEFAAACVAGVLTLEQAMKLVVSRGQLIQALPQGGGMLAIRATEAEVAPLLVGSEQVSFAALNAPQSVVVAGPVEALDALAEQLKSRDISATRLNVSHGFHSALMEQALSGFAEVAQTIDYHTPKLTFISSVSGKVEDDLVATAAYWVDHIRRTVRFADAFDSALESGIDTFIEVGPDATLCGIVKSHPACVEGRCRTVATLDKKRPEQAGKALATLFAAGLDIQWQRVYGPSNTRIALPAYPFARNHHWVKVDPLLSAPKDQRHHTVADEVQAIDPIEPHLYRQRWQPLGHETVIPSAVAAQRWLLISLKAPDGRSRRLCDGLEAQIEAGQGHCARLYLSDQSAQLGEAQFQIDSDDVAQYQQVLDRLSSEWGEPQVVVFAASLDAPSEPHTPAWQLNDLHRFGYGAALSLAQALLALKRHNRIEALPQLALLSDAINDMPGWPSSGWLHHSLWGLGKVLAQEHPELSCINVDIAANMPPQAVEQRLLQELSQQPRERQLLLSEGDVLAARLESLPVSAFAANIVHFDPQKSYLITGGLGDLALCAARWMVSRGAKHLILAARRDPDRASPNGIELTALEKQADIRLAKLDITDYAALSELIQGIQAGSHRLGGVFHFAGLLNDKAVDLQDFADFTAVGEVKGSAAWHLHQATRDLLLEHFVMLSSAAALFGSAGQANYAAANAVCDALAQYRQTLGLPALSLQLGMVSGIGMAARRHLDTKAAGKGITSVAPEQFIRALELLLGGEESVVGVVPVDWRAWQVQVKAWPFLSNFTEQSDAPKVQVVDKSVDEGLVENIKSAAGVAEAQALLVAWLSRQVARIGEFASSDIDAHASLLTLGLDSLMLVELQRRLKGELGLTIEIETLLKSGSVFELAATLAEMVVAPTETTTAEPDSSDSQDEFEEGLL